ncbi:MAG: peptidylprolyl isomerase [Aquificaceae bacterium]
MVSRSFKRLSCGILLWAALSLSTFAYVLVDRVVASVNGEAILESDVKLGMLFYGIQNKRDVINKLVNVYILAQFLEGKGGSLQDEYIHSVLLDIARANGTDLDGLAEELSKEGLTLEDLKRFLQKELLARQGLDAYLSREIKVSDVDLEIEKLKKGEVKLQREIELLTVDKKDGEKVLKLIGEGKKLSDMAKALGISVENLKVEKGDLVEPLDKEVWRAGVGDTVFAEDKDNIYIAYIRGQKDVYRGKSTEELKKEVLTKKIEERREELLRELKRKSIIKIP